MTEGNGLIVKPGVSERVEFGRWEVSRRDMVRVSLGHGIRSEIGAFRFWRHDNGAPGISA